MITALYRSIIPSQLDAGDAARIFSDTARRLLLSSRVDLTAECRAALEAIPVANLVFLDSRGLKDLDKLVGYVGRCANHVLLLSRAALLRPWVR